MKLSGNFKPTLPKMAASLLLFAVSPIFPVSVMVMDAPARIEYFSISRMLITGIQNGNLDIRPNVISAVPLVALLLIYVFVSIAEFVLSNKTLGKNISLFLKPEKAKVIIFLMGMTSFPFFITEYMTGFYHGTTYLPEVWGRIRNVTEFYIEGPGMPVALISWAFFLLNVFLLQYPFYFSTGITIFTWAPNELSEKNIAAVIMIYCLIIIEWYVFACILVSLYTRLKAKFVRKPEEEIQNDLIR